MRAAVLHFPQPKKNHNILCFPQLPAVYRLWSALDQVLAWLLFVAVFFLFTPRAHSQLPVVNQDGYTLYAPDLGFLAVDSQKLTTGKTNTVYSAASCANSSRPAWCKGTDMGAWINAAYADCPFTGCKIEAPNANETPTIYSTPIVFGVNGKNVVLDCLSHDGTWNSALLYHGSGVAVTVDNGSATDPTNAGATIRNCYFSAYPGDTPVGILLGASPTITSTNGAIGFRLEKTKLANFGTALKVGANTWGVLFDHDSFISNTLGISSPDALFDSGENMNVTSSVFIGSPITVGTGPSDWHFVGCSFDGASTITSAAQWIAITNGHFEAYDAPQLPFINATSGAVAVTDSIFLQDAATGSLGGPLIAASGSSQVSIKGISLASNITIPNLFTLTGTSSLESIAPGVLAPGSYTNPVSSTSTAKWSFEVSPGVFLGSGLSQTIYTGPSAAPSGSCSNVGWVLSQDGHATFCNGSTWVSKI